MYIAFLSCDNKYVNMLCFQQLQVSMMAEVEALLQRTLRHQQEQLGANMELVSTTAIFISWCDMNAFCVCVL